MDIHNIVWKYRKYLNKTYGANSNLFHKTIGHFLFKQLEVAPCIVYNYQSGKVWRVQVLTLRRW